MTATRRLAAVGAAAVLTAAAIASATMLGARDIGSDANAVLVPRAANEGPVALAGGRITFVPHPTQDSEARMNAAAAYRKNSPHDTVPSDVGYQYGSVSRALNDHPDTADSSDYAYRNRVVWAFTRLGECLDYSSVPQRAATPDQTCTIWAFVDANSGELVAETQQHT
jgi:hypothetical protein